jgi:hypothetical protein
MNEDALTYLAIVRLQHAYADVATRRAWREITALATADARFSFDMRSGRPIEVVGAEAFAEFGGKSVGRFSFYEYIPLNTVVTASAQGSAQARAYALEVGEDRNTGEWMNFYGLYHDDYVRVDGAWRFARRRYQTLARRAGGRLEAFPLQDRPL